MSVALAEVAAVVVTRGDVALSEIRASLQVFGELVVWDNSAGVDQGVYGRYAAIADTEAPVIYCQDDDCVLPRASLLALVAGYEPGVVTANMPERFRPHYPDSCLVGFGAVFDRELPERAFARFRHAGVIAESVGFARTCDVVFATLTARKLVDVAYRDLPWADTPERMWRQPGHVGERARMLELARRVRDEVAA